MPEGQRGNRGGQKNNIMAKSKSNTGIYGINAGTKISPPIESSNPKKKKYKAKQDNDLNAKQLKELVQEYKKVYKKYVKKDFPTEAKEQLTAAVNAVFCSWNIERAVIYRRINKITGLLGTAVNVQAMVFGNMGSTSGTGVAFTRNPSTGENKFFGEFLIGFF